MAMKKKIDANRLNLKDEVVSINRVTKVVKGGKNMSFAALVVIGDPAEGVVGYGSGKAKEVPQAIRKGIESAKKNLHKVNLTESTIPHQVLGHFGAGQVMLKPAPEGTGVIAGKTVRAVKMYSPESETGRDLFFQIKDGSVFFTAPALRAYCMIEVS